MALRMRKTTTTKSNQENALGIGKMKSNVTGLPKRPVLGEISNVHARQTTNLNKDGAEKKEIKKPTTVIPKQMTLAGSKQTTSRQPTTQSLTCKTTTIVGPSRVAVKPSVSNSAAVGPPTISLRSQARTIRPAIQKTSTSSLVPKPGLLSTRVTVPQFPENCNFNDVDKESASNIILLGEYAPDIFAYLRELETKFMVKEDFLNGQQVTPKMRSIVVDWLVDVQMQYNLLIDTLHLAISIFDRFLQAYRTITRQKLQLVGVSAMWIACKYEELFAPDLENFVYITDRAYTKSDIIKMEQVMHKALNFSYGGPLSIRFLRRYSSVSKAHPKHHTYAKYFLELALVSYKFSSVRPSLVAAVALYISFCVVDEDIEPGKHIWTDCLAFYSSYSFDDLKPYIPIMSKIILETKTAKLQAIPRKYSSSKLYQVSSNVHLKTEVLETLASTECDET